MATVVVGAMMFVGGGAVAVYHRLTTNIGGGLDLADFRPDDVPDATEPPEEESDAPPEDPKAGQPINILMLGSDSRSGENLAIGGGEEDGARSDTSLLAHIPADRSRVDIISIPRDLLVPVPACPLNQDDASQTSGARSEAMFNSAFATGAAGGDVHLGAICSALTVEQMTGLVVDEYAVVDFSGFERMVDTIGGVPMCIPEPIVDPLADLELTAGDQVLNGQQALGLARARKIAGSDGSDIQRIDRQQELLAAVARQVLSKNLVTDSYALVQFLDAVTESLSVSSGIGSPVSLAGLAMSLSGVGADGISFATMPFDYAGNRVKPNALSEDLWERLRTDQPITTPEPPVVADPAAPVDPAAPTDPATETPEPTEEPSEPWNVVSGTDAAVC